jgi:hypothetical protein
MFCASGKVYTLSNHNLTEPGIKYPTICTIFLCTAHGWVPVASGLVTRGIYNTSNYVLSLLVGYCLYVVKRFILF